MSIIKPLFIPAPRSYQYDLQIHELMKTSFMVFAVTSLIYLLHASYAERAFFGDGITYFINMVEAGGAGWHEPSRRIAHIIMKIPAALAIKAGITDLHFLARLYSMSLLLFPLLFICISYWCLPQDKKHLFIYPVMAYLAGITASSFQPIGEAQFGAAYFWIIAFLLIYKPVDSMLSRLSIFALCLPVVLVHEAYTFLGILLFLICAYRYTTASTRINRQLFIILCAWFIFVVLFNLYNVLEPRSVINRDGFIQGTLELRFLGHFSLLSSPGKWKFNGPALLGVITFGAIFLLVFLRHQKYAGIISKLIVFVFSLYICVDIFLVYSTFWPSMQTSARAYGAILSFILFPMMLFIEKYAHARFMIAFKDICQIIIMISIAQMIWQIGATWHWSNYLKTIDHDLSASSGIISFNNSSISNDFIDGYPIKRMVRGHTIPCLSITRAENGIVKTIIDFPPNVRHRPCNPHDPGNFPQLPGFNYDPFIQALQSARY